MSCHVSGCAGIICKCSQRADQDSRLLFPWMWCCHYLNWGGGTRLEWSLQDEKQVQKMMKNSRQWKPDSSRTLELHVTCGSRLWLSSSLSELPSSIAFVWWMVLHFESAENSKIKNIRQQRGLETWQGTNSIRKKDMTSPLHYYVFLVWEKTVTQTFFWGTSFFLYTGGLCRWGLHFPFGVTTRGDVSLQLTPTQSMEKTGKKKSVNSFLL